MGLVITVAQQKGGAGKTMLVANLTAAFASVSSGARRVAAVDIDPQKSLARWAELRAARRVPAPPVDVSDIAGWRLAAELDKLKRTHDVVLIDSPPRIDTDARVAVRAADIVLVPLQPTPPDLWAAEGTLALAAAERRRVCLVLNRAPATSRLRSAMESELSRRGLHLLPAGLGNRAGFANAFAVGLGVTEAAPRSVAAAEIVALMTTLEQLIA